MTRSELIESNRGLVKTVINTYFPNTLMENDDLFQEGIFGLMYAVDHFDESRGAKFSYYACRCIYHSLARVIRRDNKRYGTLYLDAPIPGIPEYTWGETILTEDKELDNTERRVIVERLLNRLTPQQREIITQYYFNQLDTTELAKIYGLTHQAVSLRLHKALNRLRRFKEAQ